MCVEKPLNQNQSNRIGALGAVILPPPATVNVHFPIGLRFQVVIYCFPD